MNVLILDEDQLEELAELNGSGVTGRQLVPANLDDGRKFLDADLLEDCGPGQTWEHYATLLGDLEIVEIEPSEIEEPAIVWN